MKKNQQKMNLDKKNSSKKEEHGVLQNYFKTLEKNKEK